MYLSRLFWGEKKAAHCSTPKSESANEFNFLKGVRLPLLVDPLKAKRMTAPKLPQTQTFPTTQSYDDFFDFSLMRLPPSRTIATKRLFENLFRFSGNYLGVWIVLTLIWGLAFNWRLLGALAVVAGCGFGGRVVCLTAMEEKKSESLRSYKKEDAAISTGAKVGHVVSLTGCVDSTRRLSLTHSPLLFTEMVPRLRPIRNVRHVNPLHHNIVYILRASNGIRPRNHATGRQRVLLRESAAAEEGADGGSFGWVCG